MLLVLVRHAVTAVTGKTLIGWLPGYSLSSEGKRQAETVAERLATFPVRAVYSSPLERCAETANVIARHHRLSVIADPDLGEIRYGKWQGRSLKSLYKTKAWLELRARPADFRFPEGETIREAQARAMSFVEDLRKKHPKQMVVVCSHADWIRVVVAGLLALPLDSYNRVSIAPASVTAFAMREGGPLLLRLSDTGSLDDLAERLKAMMEKKERKR